MGSLFHLAVFRAEGNLDYKNPYCKMKEALGGRRSSGECIVTTIRFIMCK